jgi:hypothetical protein
LSIFLGYAILVAITPSSETKNVQLNEPTWWYEKILSGYQF